MLGGNPDLAWTVNERFLTDQIEAGVPRIDYAGNIQQTLDSAPASAFRRRELEFLEDHAPEKGYELIGNAWVKTR